jgi:ribosomal protein S27AE
MADPFCPNCGTEVDDDARFCPTCGQTLTLAELDDADEPTAAVIPPAPAWPPPPDESEPMAPALAAAPSATEEPMGLAEPPAAAAEAPPPEVVHAGPAPPAGPGTAPTRTEPDLPFTWPTTLGGWLIGAGSGFAALSLLPVLGHLLNLLLFVALLAVAASVFLADRMPRVEHQRLIVLVTLTVGLGVALDRAAFTVRGLETIFLIAMLVAAGGALLIELDRDRPVPPLGGAS